jgi:hypothetical protein
LRCNDFSFRLVDSGQRTVNLCIFQLALTTIVFDRRLCRLNAGHSLRHLRLVVVVIELDEQVALVDQLIVVDVDFAHQSGNFCAERSEITPNIGIIRHLLDAATFPAVPVAGNGHDDGDRQKQDDQRRPVLLPGWFKTGRKGLNRLGRGCGRRRGGGCWYWRSCHRVQALLCVVFDCACFADRSERLALCVSNGAPSWPFRRTGN